MRTRTVVLIFALIASATHAQNDAVRVLGSDIGWAALGTDQFSLRVDRTGAIGDVMVGETEYCWLIRLYTRPIVPETGEGVRAVQGEISNGGLGPPPEGIAPEIRGENASVVIRRTCGRDEIAGGAPMYDLTQTVTVHPSGLVNLRYEFDWLRLVQMHSASLVIALRAEPLDGCAWSADFTSHAAGGTIDAAPEAKSIPVRNQPLRTFTAQCPDADLHLWFNRGDSVSVQRWNPKDYAFFVSVPHVSRTFPIYPGVRSVLDVDLKLPVPRED
ncbi:MAG: hypothetical protein GF393_12675 [Armatimonadia bacterium]|nr:hypothetical protein [Armatimonadia bacterium]